MSNPSLTINGRKIGAGEPVYVIAELSANHNQDFNQAVKLIEAAHRAGADALKLQTYTPDTMTIDSHGEYFQIEGTIWEGRNLYDLYKEAYTPWEWQPKLKEIANGLGLHLFSTPFDGTAVDFLEQMDVPAYKIASFENVDFPLLRRVGRTGKPVIMSTGMATLEEIKEAVLVLQDAGADQIALLKCTSAYPSQPEEMNLRTIPYFASTFQLPIGLSDHTLDIIAPITSVALGGCIIEKHFTLSRSVPGPDTAFSLEPHEFKAMVEAVRTTEQALGDVVDGPAPSELKSMAFRRSLFVVEDVKAGEPFTLANVRSIRPSNGLHTRYLDLVIGKKATRDIPRGTPLAQDMFDL